MIKSKPKVYQTVNVDLFNKKFTKFDNGEWCIWQYDSYQKVSDYTCDIPNGITYENLIELLDKAVNEFFLEKIESNMKKILNEDMSKPPIRK